MSATKHIFLIVLQIITIVLTHEVFQAHDSTQTDIRIEPMIRNLTIDIFFMLKSLMSIRIKQYLLVYNYLASLNSKEYKNLRNIVKLTRVDKQKINNGTWVFITILDNIIEEEIKPEIKTEFDEEDVIGHVTSFLEELEIYKKIYKVENAMSDMNAQIIEHINEDHYSYEYGEDEEVDYFESSGIDSNDDDEFWEPSRRRIFKGTRTNIKEFPFMASILIFNQFQCAGSIIKSDLIISASSCLQLAYNNRFFRENPGFLSVRVGSTFSNGGGEVIPVLEVYFHPQYNPKNLRNNLCLLRIARKLNFRKKKKVKKIKIGKIPHLSKVMHGVTIVGWGAKTISNVLTNPIMSYAVLDIYNHEDCQEIYSRTYVTRKHFCAGFISKGSGACNRDVGGPGIVNGILAGVVTHGSPICGALDSPTVFTKLECYTDWIEEIMEQRVPYIKKLSTTTRARSRNTFFHYASWSSTNLTTEANTIFMPNYAEPLSIHEKPRSKYDPRMGEYTSSTERLDTEIQLTKIKDDKLFEEFTKNIFNSKEFEEQKKVLRDPEEEFEELNIPPGISASNETGITARYKESTLMGEVDPELLIDCNASDDAACRDVTQQFAPIAAKKSIFIPTTATKRLIPKPTPTSEKSKLLFVSLPTPAAEEPIISFKELKPMIKNDVADEQTKQNFVNFIDNENLKKVLEESLQDEDLDDMILDILKNKADQLDDLDDSILTLFSSADVDDVSAKLTRDRYKTEEADSNINLIPFTDNT